MLPVSLDCPFLIAPSVFSNVYLPMVRTMFIWLSNLLKIMVPDEGCSKHVRTYADIYYHWVYTSAGGLLVPEGIIHPVISISVLTLFFFFRYMYY